MVLGCPGHDGRLRAIHPFSEPVIHDYIIGPIPEDYQWFDEAVAGRSFGKLRTGGRGVSLKGFAPYIVVQFHIMITISAANWPSYP